jgi:ureidoacrylate peracid hydrolase
MQDNRPTRHRAVSVEAKPEPVTIDIARTAALVVDMQNDFGAKGGMFDRAGIDISITRGAIEPTARALALCAGRGYLSCTSSTDTDPTSRT